MTSDSFSVLWKAYVDFLWDWKQETRFTRVKRRCWVVTKQHMGCQRHCLDPSCASRTIPAWLGCKLPPKGAAEGPPGGPQLCSRARGSLRPRLLLGTASPFSPRHWWIYPGWFWTVMYWSASFWPLRPRSSGLHCGPWQASLVWWVASGKFARGCLSITPETHFHPCT